VHARQHDEYPAMQPVAALDASFSLYPWADGSDDTPAVMSETAVQNMISSFVAQIAAAYQCGAEAGYIDGYSDGLRETLENAALALGTAA
jgi:hypothetical protein